jgi:hypothetical protein
MSATAETEKMLADMTRAEKAELLRWIVRDLGDDFPGIASPVSLPRYRFPGIKSKVIIPLRKVRGRAILCHGGGDPL